MRKLIVALATAGAVLAAPAVAQTPDAAAQPVTTAADAPPADTPPIALHGGITGVTDYRFRGLSQTNKRAAIQGTITANHESGFYVGIWTSTISNYVASSSPAELDLFAGYKKTTESGTTFDGGLLYYVYPDTPGVTSNFFEPYANVSHTFGGLTAKVGGNFAWKQSGLSTGAGKESGLYVYGELGAAIPDTGISITGHLGRSFNENYITFGTKYTDFSLTAAYTFKSAATISVGYVDTNKSLFSYPAGGGRNRNISKGGFVGSLAFTF